MQEINFIGDVHGRFDQLLPMIGSGKVYQLGDLGIGFPGHKYPLRFPSNFKFLRGNHDNPKECQKHPNYLGEFGFDGDIFYISGAYSLDRNYRVEGRDWWRDEELDYFQLENAINAFADKKPRIVISHDGPHSATIKLFDIKSGLINSKTVDAMEVMLSKHQPKLWIFSHWHPVKLASKMVNKTRFVCVPCNTIYTRKI